MRRPGDPKSEITTAANSEGPSASVSEVGADGDSTKPKSQLTREEREKQYAEVRERIFGKSDLTEGNECNASTDENDQSRSSSSNGKKKPTKKQRNLSNDDFEPRSQFPAYYPQAYPTTGYQSEQYYYPQYPSAAPKQGFQTHSPGPNGMPFQQSFSPAISPDGHSYPCSGQSPQLQQINSIMPGFAQGATPSYDLSAHFRDAMQFQNAQHGGPLSKGVATPMTAYLPPAMPAPQVMMSQWQQPMNPIQGYDGSIYGSPGFTSQGMHSSSGNPYSYPHMQSSYQGDSLQQMQAMYNNQQFNPQTQAFVPSGPGQRFMGVSTGPASYQQFSHGQPPPHYIRSNQAPQAQSSPPSFAVMQGHNQAQPSYPTTNTTAQYHHKPTAAHEPQHQNTASSHEGEKSDDPVNGEKPVLEITAKFGMPSHLPPRPPPPQTMEPHKFHEINRGVGGLHAYPGMPRMASGVFTSSSGPGGGRSGSSQS